MTPRENSVKQLSELYNVVTGVSLSFAITKIVDPSASSIPIKWDALFTFLSFLVVILPFHQGAVRHLYATYVEVGGSSRIKQGALAFDFILLFFQSCIFVAMSVLIDRPELFTNLLIGLLIVDCVWGLLAHLAFVGAQAQLAEKKWALINLITVAILFAFSKLGPPLLDGWSEETKQLVFVICFLRTAFDYYFCWDFYYPSPR
jgi:hypothetical protein